MFIKLQREDGWMLYLNRESEIKIWYDIKGMFNDKGYLFTKDHSIVGAMPKLPKNRSFSMKFIESLLSSKPANDGTIFLKKYEQNALYSITFGKVSGGKPVSVVGSFDNLGIRIDYPQLNTDDIIRFKNSLESKTTNTFHIS